MAEDVETKTCPNCASEVGETAKVCPHCHYSFRWNMSRTKTLVIVALVVLVVIGAVLYRRRLDAAEACGERQATAFIHNLPKLYC